MIRDVPTGFKIPDADLDPGSRAQKDTGSRIRIRNIFINSLIMIVRVTVQD
jgi:hypothetical protein